MGPRGPTSSARRPLQLRTTNPLAPTPDPTREVTDQLAAVSISPPPVRPAGKPKLGLQVAIGTTPRLGYYGGPADAPEGYLSPGEDDNKTIRPALTMSTALPARTDGNQAPESRIRNALDNISSRPPLRSTPSNPGSDDDVVLISALPGTQWTDDMLEEIGSLGEGAGGAVHKVMDKRTGRIMARKTITTREAPVRQLLRELNILSTTEHVNIITFYGAYMSPSSSEVKILMEFGEGGSLESVGKRIRERGAIVGEKIAGRIAEGVSVFARASQTLTDRVLGLARVGILAHEEDHPPRYQALEYPAFEGRRS